MYIQFNTKHARMYIQFRNFASSKYIKRMNTIKEQGFFAEAFRRAFDPIFAAEESANDIINDAEVDHCQSMEGMLC